ncbi:MAG: protein translocase subunit SecF [Actinobacteria bacterium]|nr:protein translocase subunit SecF [Actinomycetota bacterium]
MVKLSGLGGRLYSGETSFNIVGNRRRWYSISAIFILLSIGALLIQGLHLGIEFKGGSSYTVNKAGTTVEQARAAVADVDIPGEIIVQKIGDDKVKVQTGALSAAQSAAVEKALTIAFNVPLESIDTQLIGPSWGKEITKKALYGLIAFLIVIMIFLTMIFEPKMAVSAIVAVVHDVFITVGIYALVGFDVTPATVIGFLTILGYSLAILFVGAGLLGAGTLKDLSLALFIGLAVGTYSSIFIAPPFLASLREKEPAMQALAKRVASRGGAEPVAVSSSANNERAAIRPSVGRGPRNQPKRKGRK